MSVIALICLGAGETLFFAMPEHAPRQRQSRPDKPVMLKPVIQACTAVTSKGVAAEKVSSKGLQLDNAEFAPQKSSMLTDA